MAEAPPVWLLSDELAPGTVVGERFEIVRPLGRGGLGVVYLARDRVLARDVALKLHRRFEGERGAQRLEDEARTIAALNHPNIVSVYGLVHDGPRLFVAMEYVKDGDARRWTRAERRSYSAVLRVYLGAARGLAAAHEVGIAHADFKPDNVLVGDDGRARIIDFGLGLGRSSGATPPGSPSPSSSLARPWVGTKRYMAPEQARGVVGPAGDQFAFCVALAEGLFGSHPSAGSSAEEVLAGRERGLRAARILAIGLRVDPAQRHPSMAALVRELEALARPPRRWLAPALVSAAVGALIVALLPSTETCGNEDDDSAARYADVLRPSLEAAFAQHRAGTSLWPSVDGRLEDYAGRIATARAEACARFEDAASFERAARDPGRTRRCLDDRERELEAAVALISGGGDDVLARAPAIVGGLDSIERCEDPNAVATSTPDDPRTAAEVGSIRAELRTASALRSSDRLAESLDLARSLLLRADALAFPPLRPEVLLELGRAELAMTLPEAGLEHLEAAYFSARSTRRDALAFDIALEIVTGFAAEPRVREAWLVHAETLALTSPVTKAKLALARGTVQIATSDYEGGLRSFATALTNARNAHTRIEILGWLAETEVRLDRVDDAMAHIDEALTLAEDDRGVFSLQYAHLLDRRGMAYLASARPDAALVDQTRARDIASMLLGPDHAETLDLESNMASVHFELGDHAAAAEVLERVLNGRMRSLGTEHRLVAFARLHLGNARIMLDEREDAEVHLREALRLFEGEWGGDIDVAFTLQSLGSAVAGRDPNLATTYLERAVQALERGLGPEHLDTVKARLTLGDALADAGRGDEAVALVEAQLARLRERDGGRSPAIVEALYVLAWGHLSRDDPAAAAAAAERGLVAIERIPSRSYLTGPLSFAAGQALWEVGERGRAVEFVEAAAHSCDDPTQPCAVELAHVNEWLSTHR